ncbi:MAG TPA: hypothetical protein DCE41_09825 [Cytophagales bacterium]|nr:hypothetical protein [Cytophagales bacterium]HAA23909.1 hypothetical protein [Cytophagales bacterium]HAP60147.1 hypothetical protein [Cytophagales bacterium]
MPNADSPLLGEWKVEDRFHSATYQILSQNRKTVGRVLLYDDGTTHYVWQPENARYIFQDVEEQGGLYVNGLSGATSQNSAKSHEIEVVHPDTLKVTSFHGELSISELWIRNN